MPEIRDFEDNFQSPDWLKLAELILDGNGYRGYVLQRAGGTDHVVVFVGDDLVLKIYRPERSCFERELAALELVAGRTRFSTPEIVLSGKYEDLDHLLMTRIRGDEMTRPEFLSLDFKDQSSILAELASELKALHAANGTPTSLSAFRLAAFRDWNEFVEERAATTIERQIAHGVNTKIIAQLPKYIEESLPLVPREPSVFMHADVHFGNLRFSKRNGSPAISGLFDFADSRVGWHEYDILAIGVLIVQGERELQREFLRAYGYADNEMNDEMRRRLMMLTMLYETADLRRYALRLRPDAVDLDLYELEKAIWSFV